jgi:hypothetical protein
VPVTGSHAHLDKRLSERRMCFRRKSSTRSMLSTFLRVTITQQWELFVACPCLLRCYVTHRPGSRNTCDPSLWHRFESETSVHSVSSKQIQRTYDATPCSPAEMPRHFEGTYCLHIEGIRVSHVRNRQEAKQCVLLVSRHHAVATYGGVEVSLHIF